MIGERINELKGAILESKDSLEIMMKFFNDIAMSPVFYLSGKLCADLLVHDLFSQATASMYKSAFPDRAHPEIKFGVVASMSEYSLVYGYAFAADQTALFLYFDDLDIGAGKLFSCKPDSWILIVKFSINRLLRPTEGNMHLNSSKTQH